MDLSRFPPYDTIDFKELAKVDEEFREIWHKSSGHLDFQDPATVQTLTQAILRKDFGLHLELPGDRLCPPVPNRWNYVSWIQALVDSTAPGYSAGYDPQREVVGLDIGTGASAIYTLLCLRTRPRWSMCATDVDKKSFASAVRNLTLNHLVTRARMLQTIDSNPIIPLRHFNLDRLDFTICNPPFFASETDMRSSLKGEGKSLKPNAVCTGCKAEMVYPGGDLGFVTRIIEESLVLREKVAWYTSMFGMMSSAKAAIDLLKKNGVTNWAVGSIDAGTATRRWIVAWSFGNYRPRNDIARLEKFANEYLPFPTEYRFHLPPGAEVGAAKDAINKQLLALDMRWAWDPTTSTGIAEAAQNVWKRAYRREHERRKKEESEDTDMGAGLEDKQVALAVRIKVIDDVREVLIEWLRGSDQVLWESFCGMVHRNFKKS